MFVSSLFLAVIWVPNVWTIQHVAGCGNQQMEIEGRCCNLCPPGKRHKWSLKWQIKYIKFVHLIITLSLSCELREWFYLFLVLKVNLWRRSAQSKIKLSVAPVTRASTPVHIPCLASVRNACHAHKVRVKIMMRGFNLEEIAGPAFCQGCWLCIFTQLIKR